MLNISEQFANAGKQTFQSQIALLQKLSQKAFESSQKIIALHISTSKTLLGDNHELVEHWIHSKHPFEFWVKDAHEAQPGLHHLFHYERELAHILTSAQAELLTFAFSEVAEIQNELADLGSHLHEHNKAKQDVVKQAAHAYSAEIKSLYPQPKASTNGKTKEGAKPAEEAKATAKPVAKAVAKAAVKSAAKSADKPVAKGTSSREAGTGAAVAEIIKPAVKAATAEKPQAKASATSKQAANAPVAKADAKPANVAASSPKATASKAPAKAADKPVAKAEVKARPAVAEVAPQLHHTAEESHRPPMPRPAVQHQLEVHAEAPSILNLDDQVVE